MCRCGPDAVAGVEWPESGGGPDVGTATYKTTRYKIKAINSFLSSDRQINRKTEPNLETVSL